MCMYIYVYQNNKKNKNIRVDTHAHTNVKHTKTTVYASINIHKLTHSDQCMCQSKEVYTNARTCIDTNAHMTSSC